MDWGNHIWGTGAWGHTALINGEQIHYDLCHDKKESKFSDGMKYLGVGTIYSICAVLQESDKPYHFWAHTGGL